MKASVTNSLILRASSWEIFVRQPTAREVFMEMVVRHVLEVTGGMGSGAVVPFQSIKQEHSLDKVTVYVLCSCC